MPFGGGWPVRVRWAGVSAVAGQVTEDEVVSLSRIQITMAGGVIEPSRPPGREIRRRLKSEFADLIVHRKGSKGGTSSIAG